MSISPIEPAGASREAATAAPARAPKQVMDSEVFLHLLVTQLANQDPSSPMDTNQMISQTTQLASMERLNTMAAAQQYSLDIQQRTAASSLIGQQATSADEPALTGLVTAVAFTAEGPVLTVGENQIPLSRIAQVQQAPDTAQPPADLAEPPSPAEPDGPEENLAGPEALTA
ncbi:flagellar hook assembly protein FlgD [Glutamicibacter sp. 0426]|uniref:flagellar hook assembly protein FlgD n=1 Tax=Glutamicibacter sp. 0426 TaxID=1913445 RepID=UPI0009395A10|nr:flagellar hook capping FlgD N-terminal domain-containing protein [Glutamicibacter sp. 0426]